MSNIYDLSPACSIITGDFNARSTKWWKLDKENLEGREINIITHAAGYSQLLNQPTHITKDSLFCIDLIFTSNPNLVNSSGVECHSLKSVIITWQNRLQDSHSATLH